MQWSSISYLWLLAVVAAVAALLVLALRRRRELLKAFAELNLVDRLTPDVDERRRWVRIALRLTVLGFITIALAGPKWGFHWEEVKRQGIDLIVAIDTSRSMLATDVKPNRLERAKLAVLDLVQLLEGDRVGLVAFAGTAFLECPLTLDRAAFERSLRAIDVGIIPRGGTALARAIDTSLGGFEARQGKFEALILITDGEDHEGEVEEAAKRAAERGVKAYTVGIGTSEGELIPGADGKQRGYLKNRRGEVVKSRLNEEVLQQIALATSGAYVRGSGTSLGLDEVFRDHIAKMERREVASSLERRYEDRFQIPLAIALVLLLGEALTGERKRERQGWGWLRRGSRAKQQAAATVLLFALLPSLVGWLDPPGDRAAEGNRLYAAGKYSEAGDKYGEGLVDAPQSPLLQFNRGTALYKQGKYAEAIEAWTKVATSGEPEWVARAAYNLGNAQFQLGSNAEQKEPQAAIGSYQQALASYKRAMGSNPTDDESKFNHELVEHKLAELEKRLEEERKKKEQEQEQKQEQQEQQQDQQQPEQQGDQQQQEQQQEGQEQPPEDQAQDQAQEQPQNEPQPQEEQQAGNEPEQQPQPQEQPGEEQPQEQAAQPQPDEQHEQPATQQGGGEPLAGEKGEETPDQQAAQAVIDVAGEEELGPEDIKRPAGVAGVLEPAQDW